MSESVFPYPGGKTYLANWIIEQFPEHECYVEVFGGSASILVNKPQSRVEVFNDLNGDIVQFFDVLRERHEELQEWLETVPYSRELYSRWGTSFYDGERPDDPVERAGRFFFLRYTIFSGTYDHLAGFRSSPVNDEAGRFVRAGERLSEFATRLRTVQIEHKEYSNLLDQFDSPETLFYCDPPYVQQGNSIYLTDHQFDQKRFVDSLHDLAGKWIVSYTDLPPGLDEYHVIERNATQEGSNPKTRKKTSRIERLVMNFSPDGEPIMSELGQCGLDQFV